MYLFELPGPYFSLPLYLSKRKKKKKLYATLTDSEQKRTNLTLIFLHALGHEQHTRNTSKQECPEMNIPISLFPPT